VLEIKKNLHQRFWRTLAMETPIYGGAKPDQIRTSAPLD